MVEYKYADLFLKENVDKQIYIVSDDGLVNITNTELHFEKFELTESLCSERQLRFGTCEASVLKFRVSNVFLPMEGNVLAVTETLDGNTDIPFLYGKYKVVSDTPDAKRLYRDVAAYDAMHDILHAEVSEWYNGLVFPMTLKQFRDSFFAWLGIEQESADLVNDSMTVEKTIAPSELSGKVVVNAICELNGGFGHIVSSGKFRYVFLPQCIDGLYPANDLHPENTLYPRESNTSNMGGSYISCKYEDFTVQSIAKLQIRKEENDIGAIVGEGDNCYIVEDNFLVYGKGTEELNIIANNLFSVIKDVVYRPFVAVCQGNPCREIGDAVKYISEREIIESYILKRSLKGIQGLIDTYEAEGEKIYSQDINSVNKSLIELKGKTNVLERSVEEMKSTIANVEEGLETQIEQTAASLRLEASETYSTQEEMVDAQAAINLNAHNIGLKVSKGDLSAEISAEAGEIQIKSNRLTIESDNFKLSKTGEVEASGTFNSTTIESGVTYESMLGNGGFRLKRGGVEAGKVVGGSAYGTHGIGVHSESLVTIGGAGKVGYMCNPQESLDGYTERNIFAGTSRFFGKVTFESGSGVTSVSGIYASDGAMQLIPSNGNNAVFLRGTDTQSKKIDGTWTPVFASAFPVQSSRKVKENLSGIKKEETLNLLSIEPLHFDYIDGAKEQSGFIAEEVETVYPEICSYRKNEETGEMELFGLDYSKFVPYIVKMLQMQQQKIEHLEMLISGKDGSEAVDE